MTIFLGIETSCDETGVALVTDKREILAQELASQQKDHAPFGGVVPELAARKHLEILPDMVQSLMHKAHINPSDLTAVAATCGPGLIGGLLVGALFGKGFAAAAGKPFIGVNHLEAHALSPRLLDPSLGFPYLVLLISGGHTQLLICEGVGRYKKLGTTLDDAVGECFDKAASLLQLGQPGGPFIEKAASLAKGNNDYDLPKPLWRQKNCNFSFSGLKTAVGRAVEKAHDKNELAFAVQKAISETLADRCLQAMNEFEKSHPHKDKNLIVAGGVAANRTIGKALQNAAFNQGFSLHVAPPALCTDNGVMIAWTGAERYACGMIDDLSLKVRPRWPLDPSSAKAGARA